MDYQTIHYRVEGEVARITLNRPERRNVLTDEVFFEFLHALDAADSDDVVHVVVLDANGPHFCAGFDIRDDEENAYAKEGQPLSHYLWMIRSMRERYSTILNNRKPIIARVHGYAIAGGCYLQMLCDITIASETAILGHPAVVTGGISSMALWNWHLGLRKAKELLLTGKLIDGKEAEKIGLVNIAVPEEALDAEVDKMINQILTVPRDSIILTKESLNTAADIMGLGASFRTQGHLNAMARFGGDMRLDFEALQDLNRAKVKEIRVRHEQSKND